MYRIASQKSITLKNNEMFKDTQSANQDILLNTFESNFDMNDPMCVLFHSLQERIEFN